MKSLKTYLKFLLITIPFQGCIYSPGLDCSFASYPVAITLYNSSNSNLKLTLYEFNKDKGFVKLGNVSIEAKKGEQACLSYDGNVRDGLYIYDNGKLTLIDYKLKNNDTVDMYAKQIFILNLEKD